MNQFWIQRITRTFFALIILSTVGFSLVFAQVSSHKSEADKIDPTEIQKALTEAGFYKGTIDGVIGKKTRAAIRAFQTQNGLTADGVCGRKTWEKLKTYLEEKPIETDATQIQPQTQPDLFSPTVDEGVSLSDTPIQEPEPSAPSDELKQKLVS